MEKRRGEKETQFTGSQIQGTTEHYFHQSVIFQALSVVASMHSKRGNLGCVTN